MNYQELEKYSFVLEEHQRIYKIVEDKKEINIYIKTEKHECECPECHQKTNKMVSTYKRIVQDTPIMNKTVKLHITAGEYHCENEDCPREYFCQRLELVEKGQRRTKRLNEFILAGGAFQSAKTAELTMGMQGVRVSHDSIQRLFNRLVFEDRPEVERIGIDEIALKKGHDYATVIYDYDDGTLLELIKGRKKEDVLPWLLKHQNIKFVARDRSSSYSSAISEALPDCEQVADRFHLFQNLSSYLDKWKKLFPGKTLYFKDGELLEKAPKMENYYPELDSKILKELDYDNSEPVDEDGKVIKYDKKVRDLTNGISKKQAKRRKEKKALVEKIRETYFSDPKSTYAGLGRKFGKDPNTIKKYVLMSEEQVKELEFTHKYKKKKCKSDPYINIIYKMLRDGYKFSTIFNYISQQDFFEDSSANLSVTIRFIAKANFENYNELNSNDLKAHKLPQGVKSFKRPDVIRLIAKRDRSEVEESYLNQITQRYPIYKDYQVIFERFHEIIMSEGKLKINQFIDEFSFVLPDFCESLQTDMKAVRNAVSSTISSGFVEGNNNKIKLIKRILYGRSGIVNLKVRCALAFSIDQDGFNFTEHLKAA